MAAIAEPGRAIERASDRLFLPVIVAIEVAWLAVVAYVVVRFVT